MSKITKLKRSLALLLAVIMMLSLAACSPTATMNIMMDSLGIGGIAAGEKLADSPWINSDLDGAIDETVHPDLKDDFHSAVNRDWFIETSAPAGEIITPFSHTTETLDKQLVSLLQAEEGFEVDTKIMSQEDYDHHKDLVVTLMDLATDWDSRNELGIEPLRPYLEAIESIESLDDLTDYLMNKDGMNFLGEDFVNYSVDIPLSSRDAYTVHISFVQHMLLDPPEYTRFGTDAEDLIKQQREKVVSVLTKFGYSPKEADKLFLDCYWFENKLKTDLPSITEQQSQSYISQADNQFSLEELEQRQGNFPLTELLENDGLTGSDSFTVYEAPFIRSLGKLYTESNLESFKAYFTVHTILEALPYLDEESAISAEEMGIDTQEEEESQEEDEEEDDVLESDKKLSPEEQELYDTAAKYVFPNLLTAFQQLYIGRYCSSEMKEDLTAMVNDIREYYYELLGGTQWLSEETRENAINKLEKMEMLILYPDVLEDFSSLNYEGYDEGGNLLDAICSIRNFNADPEAEKLNKELDRAAWDLDQLLTIDINAFYVMTTNQVVICAGLNADGFFYDVDAPIEQNYARIGAIIGHEITHAFDTGGYQYDADGLENSWWTNDDVVEFKLRADKLANHYSTLSVIPGMPGGYNGDIVSGEAIADMGGVKCMLALAEKIEDFDYELFFESYANLWRAQTDMQTEMILMQDVHPLSFLRTNVTLQQFDKFYETYDIGPGDGMYLAPENRIMVW